MLILRFIAAALLAGAAQAAIAQVAAPAATLTAAAVDPDTVFKGKMGGTFGRNIVEVMPAAKRVAIPAFRVAFIVDNSISAQVRGAYLPGVDFSGARSSFYVTLKGVDAATMQAVTDKAYQELLAQLAASGREVVPLEQLAEHLPGLKASSAGYTKEHNGQTAMFFAPTGMPLTFTHFEGGWGDAGMLDLSNYRKLQEISAKTNALVIAPLVFVNFAKMSSSGNQSGLMARTAETGAELAMSVAGLTSLYLRTEEFRNGMLMKGDEGSFQMAGAVTSPLPVGTLQVVAQDDNRAIRTTLNVIGFFAGMPNAGGAARSSTKAVAESSNEAYAAAATDALGRFVGSLGGWFKKYPPAN